MTVAQALVAAAARLSATSDTARLDAEVLMAHLLGVSRGEMILRHMAAAAPEGFDALIARREAHEPVAYIVGHQEFWGLELAVSPEVLIPRGDTETLIVAALEAFAARAPTRIIDLGTGSGALLLAALHEWPGAEGIGIDRSAGAVAVARGNAARLGMAARIEQADWTRDGWSDGLGRFDLVLANPPYIEAGAALDASVMAHEPHGALFAGADGLNDYRALAPQLPGLLAHGGRALVEIGWTQGAAVLALAESFGMAARVHRDLAGRDRAVEIVADAAHFGAAG